MGTNSSCDDREAAGIAMVDDLTIVADGLRSFIVSGARVKSGISLVNERGDGMVEMDGTGVEYAPFCSQ